MSIEDVNYLKANSIKQSYTFLIDSKDRDRNVFPNPNNYVVEFSTPFKNIIGMEIIDASIPRTMYNVDVENNSVYYYIGSDEDDKNIKDGITDYVTCDLNLRQGSVFTNFIDNNSLLLFNKSYASLSNSINLYNIYNNIETHFNYVGGNTKGITFSMKIKAYATYKSGGQDNAYTIIDFSYDHLIRPNIANYSPITIKIIKQPPFLNVDNLSTFNISFTIGNETNELVVNNINFEDFIHVAWCISEDNTWTIYINGITDSSKTFKSSKSIQNVFYTNKYIGKRANSALGDWDTSSLYIKDFKIYNKVLAQGYILKCINNESLDPVIWYKMNQTKTIDEKIHIENAGINKDIYYLNLFNKIVIMPGDYTIKTFFTNYDELNDFEIGFKEHSDPSELTNLIDIYSKKPFILDMNRSTISENLGFDLYANSVTNGRYTYKNIYKNNTNMIKFFHSITNDNPVKEFNDGFVDIYKIVSPGIVYFIGNKYIIMRCPEIEAHLYRSLSYSKYTLGLAKFRVDNVGINNEKLSITKLPVREFHPIGKLSKMTLKFETNTGSPYDFKGVNHNIVFAIYYYEPTQLEKPKNSLLNPEYKMNYLEYQYRQEEIEGDSDDDDEDFSRDNIDLYKENEELYSEEGVKLQQINKYYMNKNNIELDESEESEESD